MIERITLIVAKSDHMLYVYGLLQLLLIDAHSVITQSLDKRAKRGRTQNFKKSLLASFIKEVSRLGN